MNDPVSHKVLDHNRVCSLSPKVVSMCLSPRKQLGASSDTCKVKDSQELFADV